MRKFVHEYTAKKAMHFISNKRFYILMFGFCLSLSLLHAQSDSIYRRDYRPKKEEPKDKMTLRQRLFWGGNVGAWLGNPTFVDLSPLLGIKINQKLSIGVGGIYNYYSYKYNNYKYSVNFYGVRINARYFIYNNIFLQAGVDEINRDNPYSYFPNERIWIQNVLVGGGLRYPVSDNIYCLATGLWNLNYTPLSPYPNPIIQVGFIGRF
ncbi:MAG TPA: hypothetical protein VN026_14780 [Bacteroidia bacterium]|jgi:hypothetical protein|nr:hypothetical protein [Bacteroidia bacterium]